MKQLFILDDTPILVKNLERHLGTEAYTFIFCNNAQFAQETFEANENSALILVNPAMALHRKTRNDATDFIKFLQLKQLESKVRLLIPHQAIDTAKVDGFEWWPKDEVLFERIRAFFES